MKIAVAQSQISDDVSANGHGIRALMQDAAADGCRLIHFPEGAVSGYVEAQIQSWDDVDWAIIAHELNSIADLAGDLGLWVVAGSNHLLTPPNRPHNSLYVISNQGEIACRYDKRLCSNNETLNWYSPGTEPVCFEVDDFRFGCLLCIEIQFPELFMSYEQLGVECLLLSAYSDDSQFAMLAQAHAALNCYWLSLSVPAGGGEALASQIIGPNGEVLAKTTANGEASISVCELNRRDPRFDVALSKARPWRRQARLGEIYEARRVVGPRSLDRTAP